MTDQPKHFTLDDEPIEIESFIAENDFTSEDIAEIEALQPGEEIAYGGGAAVEFTLRRTA